MDQINVAGAKIFNIMLSIGYWICLIGGAGAIIQSVSKKDVQGAIKNALGFGVAFTALFLLKWVLDLVKDVFG